MLRSLYRSRTLRELYNISDTERHPLDMSAERGRFQIQSQTRINDRIPVEAKPDVLCTMAVFMILDPRFRDEGRSRQTPRNSDDEEQRVTRYFEIMKPRQGGLLFTKKRTTEIHHMAEGIRFRSSCHSFQRNPPWRVRWRTDEVAIELSISPPTKRPRLTKTFACGIHLYARNGCTMRVEHRRGGHTAVAVGPGFVDEGHAGWSAIEILSSPPDIVGAQLMQEFTVPGVCDILLAVAVDRQYVEQLRRAKAVEGAEFAGQRAFSG
ncbi:hypothetical protein R3P38DRAFT_3620497 [Favolaschia claudopus]|uniref:Uncharacterized protein n=1 Tax=Favolaschia claudopus TaxID=2862362 RepID=A0AAW0DCH2_9AGAR